MGGGVFSMKVAAVLFLVRAAIALYSNFRGFCTQYFSDRYGLHGNRLAGCSSDDGFVVWELPETITDDVP